MKYLKNIFCLLLCLNLCFGFVGCSKENNSNNIANDEISSDIAESNNNTTAVITVKNYGEIQLELYYSVAPITVTNFVKLANSGFYDGLTFHRIIKDFMIQGGDPEGTGMGGSKDNIYGEFSANGFQNNISHKRGVISMARLGNDMNSATSQFFIVHKDSPHLDGQYAAFGKVIKGIEVVDKLADTPSDSYSGAVEKANQPVIESIKIIKE